MIITENLDRVMTMSLDHGGHAGINDGMCVMEAVAFVSGEPWSDHPTCACPIIGTFLRAWNDALPDDQRTEFLRPLIPLLVGTRSTLEVERRRAMLAADWLIRTHTPAWLRLAGLTTQAEALASLPEVTDMAQCPSLMPTLNAVRSDAAAAWAAAMAAAGDAARAAAWAAAWDAAGDAARAAARAAAWDAAWAAAMAAAGDAARAAAWAAAMAAAGDAAGAAAMAAAGDAAGAAARAAAGEAAWAAAGDALKTTTTELQQSALDLVRRMIALTREDGK